MMNDTHKHEFEPIDYRRKGDQLMRTSICKICNHIIDELIPFNKPPSPYPPYDLQLYFDFIKSHFKEVDFHIEFKVCWYGDEPDANIQLSFDDNAVSRITEQYKIMNPHLDSYIRINRNEISFTADAFFIDLKISQAG